MKLEIIYVAILSAAAVMSASSIESDDFIYVKPRTPDLSPIRYPPLVLRNGCKENELPCGPGCCVKTGLCQNFAPGKFQCAVCPEEGQFVCADKCCSGNFG